jgi:hypothetical protein
MKAPIKTVVAITAPNVQTLEFLLSGTAPLVQARFSEKARQAMEGKMLEGTTARSKKIREPRNFAADMDGAIHYSTEGWIGVPAAAFRNAMISACRLVGFRMTVAKMSVFVLADGLDKVDGIPLVRLNVGAPEMLKMHARNSSGVTDVRVRPMWREWGLTLKVKFDADQFSATDVTNLLLRAGLQVGVGEGRPDSRESAGLGWGTFEIAN